MKWYCEKCKKIHSDEEMCPRIKEQLKANPMLLTESANFTAIAGEYALVSTQALDKVAQAINKAVGTNLTFEGTHQCVRDIQVFKRLDIERYCRKGTFRTPDAAQNYLKNANKQQLKNLKTNFNGMGQEIDWEREQASKLSSLFKKSELFFKNEEGVDGQTYYRFNKNKIVNTTVKAAESNSGIRTNVDGIIKALEDKTLKTDDIVYGVKGTKKMLQNKLDKKIQYLLDKGDMEKAQLLKEAKVKLKVTENGTKDSIKKSTQRLMDKTEKGQAFTHVTAEELSKKMAQGAVVGAAVAVTISSITNYVRYKNGELTKEEAFRDVSEDTLKGAIMGAGISAVSIFLPVGVIGFIGGVAVGIYFNQVCTNVLDEIFGKGAYGAILDSSGYVYGMTLNLKNCIKKIQYHDAEITKSIEASKTTLDEIDKNLELFEKMKE